MRLPSLRALSASPRMLGGDVARLALEVGAERDRLVAGVACNLRPQPRATPLAWRSVRKRARANAGSPGLQLSFLGSSSARRTASSMARLYFATSARASASVVGSGTVGPEAIAEGSSCGTSEIASVTISAACSPARASRPPLMRDRCLRTMFISPIGAPERSSARLTCCFCANETPSTGAIQLAEPPPESSTSSRSSGGRLAQQVAACRRRPSARPRRARDGRPRSP